MKAITVFSVLILTSAFSRVAFAFESKPLALIYGGYGICKDCDVDLGTALQLAGYRTESVFPGQIDSSTLSRAKVFVVPGGEEEADVMHAFQNGEADSIRNYVRRGGTYLGVCLGAYLTAPMIVDPVTKIPFEGLGLFQGKTPNHSPTKQAWMERILWKGRFRWVYFQDGPEFRPFDPSSVDVWAYYRDGSLAALQTSYGKGRVGLIGPHPEADQSWLDADHLSFVDGPSFDLFRPFLDLLVSRGKTSSF